MRYYVYALIDPSNNNPFYIGKGLDNRLQSHFKESTKWNDVNDTIIGCDTNSIMKDAKEKMSELVNKNSKVNKINILVSQGYNHTHIARIIARGLSESVALAVEACLIRKVYGVKNLTNRVEGEHFERFRPFNKWEYIKGYDFDYLNESFTINNKKHELGEYYVYVLRNPETEKVFYVGKGTKNRILNHFNRVRDTKKSEDTLKSETIKNLINRGFKPIDIGRIVAYLNDESHAFAIETLLAKFVYGMKNLANIQPGHNGGYFRAYNDWEKRIGFDLPFVIEPGVRVGRQEKLDLMIGEGLDIPLMEIKNKFQNLIFDLPKILDSSELAIEADVGSSINSVGARLKIFIRRKKIQIELRPRTKAQKEWIKRHFIALEAYPLRRADDVFFPDKWRGTKNMTENIQEAISRVKLMLEIVNAESRSELSVEAIELL